MTRAEKIEEAARELSDRVSRTSDSCEWLCDLNEALRAALSAPPESERGDAHGRRHALNCDRLTDNCDCAPPATECGRCGGTGDEGGHSDSSGGAYCPSCGGTGAKGDDR